MRRGITPRDVKCHLWDDEKNNTMCNMYHGAGEKQFPSKYWGLSDVRSGDICNQCKDVVRNNKKDKVKYNNKIIST